MTAIKHTLHRDVFLPNDERLLGFVHVTKVGRKKKSSFLCAVCKWFFVLNLMPIKDNQSVFCLEFLKGVETGNIRFRLKKL